MEHLKTTVIYCLTTGMCSEICIIRQVCHCANIIEYTITNLADRAYYIPGLYGIAYHSQASNQYSMLLYLML